MAIKRETASGNHAMQVRMMAQLLAPGMKHREKTNLCAQLFGIGGELQQCLRGALEQQIVDDSFILQRQLGQFLGQGKDHMEVWHRQQVCQPRLQPLGLR